MSNPIVSFNAPAAYFGGPYYALPIGVYSIELKDGVTGVGGDGDFEVVFVANELGVYGTGVNAPALHCNKRPANNPIASPYDVRVHRLAQFLVVNGVLAGSRDLRVLGGVDAGNFGPGQGGSGNVIPGPLDTGGFVTSVNGENGDIIITDDGISTDVIEAPTGTFMFIAAATLPLVNGDLPGPTFIADGLGQCIGVQFFEGT